MLKKISKLSIIIAAVGACATQPSDMSTTYVSPAKYNNYSCDQLIMEMDHISHRTATLYNSLSQKADNDAWQMGVGMVLLWPTLFFLEGGDGPEASEYSNLKGDYEAARQALIFKNCPIGNIPPSPEEIANKKAEQDAKAKDLKYDDRGPGK